MVILSQMQFGVVTAFGANGDGEVRLMGGETFAFRAVDELDPTELPERPDYLSSELPRYDVPVEGDVILLFQSEIGTVRWSWPRLVLECSQNRLLLMASLLKVLCPCVFSEHKCQRHSPHHPGLHMAYEQVSTEEDYAVLGTSGATEFPRHPVYVVFIWMISSGTTADQP